MMFVCTYGKRLTYWLGAHACDALCNRSTAAAAVTTAENERKSAAYEEKASVTMYFVEENHPKTSFNLVLLVINSNS